MFTKQPILKDIIIIICILSIAVPFLFFGLDLFMDVWRNRSMVIFFTILQEKSKIEHSLYRAMDKIMADYLTTPGHFFKESNIGLIGMTLNMILVNMFKKFIDLSVKNLVLLSGFVGIASIILMYFFTRSLYDRKIAFLSGLLIASSLIFVFMTRNTLFVYPYTIEMLLALVTFFSFWFAHSKKKHKYLLITGFSLGLNWVNGVISPFILLSILIFFVFYITAKIKGIFLFDCKKYIYIFLISFITFLCVSITYSLSLYASPLEIFNFINKYFFTRSTAMAKHGLEVIFYNFVRLFVVLFYGSIPGSRFDFSDGFGIYYWPLINPLVGPFLFIGIYKCFRGKSLSDIFISSWVFTTIFVFTFLTYFESRYINSVLPAVFIVSSLGIVYFAETVSKFLASNFKRFLSKDTIVLIISLLAIVSSIYITTYAYFIDRYQNDGYFLESFGQVQAGEYIYKDSKPEDCLVVLNDEVTIPEEIFVFATKGKPYKHIFWNVLNKGGVDILEWEKEILQYRGKIFYIFSHGSGFIKEKKLRFDDPADWSYFKKIHPSLKPVKIIYSATGIPVLFIFEVLQSNNLANKNRSPLEKVYLNSFKNGSFEDWSNSVPDYWTANSLSSFKKEEKIISDGQFSIRIDTSNSSGRLEQDITDFRSLLGKTITIRALVMRNNNASVGISIYDGISELSNESKWALRHFGTVVLMKTIPTNAKCLKIFLNINGIQSSAYFDNVEIYEGY